MSALANTIREWLKQNDKGIHGQNELADEAKIRRSTLSHLMNKENALPRPTTVKKLAGAMGVEGVILTALLGYPTQASDDPDGKYVEIARQLESFPWLISRLDDLLHLDESEFREALEHFDLAHRRRRNADQTNGSGH